MDGWVEELKEQVWGQAFERAGVNPDSYLLERDTESDLPWDHISAEIPKRYYLKEWKKAVESHTTQDCLTESCSICGACDYDGVRNVLFDRKRSEDRLGIVEPRWNAIIDQREAKKNKSPSAKSKESPARRDKLLADDDIELPKQSGAEFGSGSVDYPFQSPQRKVEVHENQPLTSSPDGATKFYQDNPLGVEHAATKQRLRVRYTKLGIARYIGHLELASVFFRAARRASIPLSFSRGFSPKPKISFGHPLQLGLASRCEYVDLLLTESIDPAKFQTDMNEQLPQGVEILEVFEKDLSKKDALQATISSQTYSCNLRDVKDEHYANINNKLSKWQNLSITKKSKKGKVSKVLLGEVVKELCIHKGESNTAKLTFTVDHSKPSGALKPLDIAALASGLDANSLEIEKIRATLAAT